MFCIFPCFAPHLSIHFLKIQDGVLKSHDMFMHCSIFSGLFIFFLLLVQCWLLGYTSRETLNIVCSNTIAWLEVLNPALLGGTLDFWYITEDCLVDGIVVSVTRRHPRLSVLFCILFSFFFSFTLFLSLAPITCATLSILPYTHLRLLHMPMRSRMALGY